MPRLGAAETTAWRDDLAIVGAARHQDHPASVAAWTFCPAIADSGSMWDWVLLHHEELRAAYAAPSSPIEASIRQRIRL